MKVWSEDITVSPLFWVWSGQDILTSALWSPARPSVILATRMDGILMVWSLVGVFEVFLEMVINLKKLPLKLRRPNFLFPLRSLLFSHKEGLKFCMDS